MSDYSIVEGVKRYYKNHLKGSGGIYFEAICWVAALS